MLVLLSLELERRRDKSPAIVAWCNVQQRRDVNWRVHWLQRHVDVCPDVLLRLRHQLQRPSLELLADFRARVCAALSMLLVTLLMLLVTVCVTLARWMCQLRH